MIPLAQVNPKIQQQRLLKVLQAPRVSEKTTYIGEKHNQYVFRVATDATKKEIKEAVELLFKVKVEAVQTSKVKGKEKRFGRHMGRRNHWKKAYISVAAGQDINFVSAESV